MIQPDCADGHTGGFLALDIGSADAWTDLEAGRTLYHLSADPWAPIVIDSVFSRVSFPCFCITVLGVTLERVLVGAFRVNVFFLMGIGLGEILAAPESAILFVFHQNLYVTTGFL